MFFDELLRVIVDTLNPFKIIANIKNAIDPTLGFIDHQLGYDNYQLCYAGRPELKTLSPNIFYLYLDDKDQLSCLIKRKDPKTKEESTDEILLPKEYLGELGFNKIVDTINKHNDKEGLDFDTRAIIYNFFTSNNVKAGYRHSFHNNITAPYNKFETNFIRKHPIIYKAYQFSKRTFNNLCTFSASQTGARVAGLASFVAMSIASGGTFAAAIAGAYAGSVAISLIQQAYYRKKLNSLTEETQLITRYLENNNKIGVHTQFNKKPLPAPDKSWLGAIKRLANSAAKHLSTYILEAAVPVAATILSPIHGIMTTMQLGAAIGLSSVGVGIGVYFRKSYDDKRLELQLEISKAKQRPDIPDYKNVEDLKKAIIQQERMLGTYKSDDPTLKSRSGLQKYWQGFKEVINPFDNAQLIEDPKIFANTVQKIALGITATATIATGMPNITDAIMPAVAIGMTAITTPSTARMHHSKKTKKLHFVIKPKEEQKEKPITIPKLTPPRQSFVAREQSRNRDSTAFSEVRHQ
jgi:hypothetical protein